MQLSLLYAPVHKYLQMARKYMDVSEYPCRVDEGCHDLLSMHANRSMTALCMPRGFVIECNSEEKQERTGQCLCRGGAVHCSILLVRCKVLGGVVQSLEPIPLLHLHLQH